MLLENREIKIDERDGCCVHKGLYRLIHGGRSGLVYGRKKKWTWILQKPNPLSINSLRLDACGEEVV